MNVRTDSPPASWDTYVDASTGEILWRENQVRLEVSGTVDAETEYINYCDGRSTLPDRNMYVDVVGQGTATTDATGAFHQATTGSGPFTLTAAFRGPWVNVDVFNGTDSQYSTSISSGSPVTVHFDSTSARQDERDCFYNVNVIHDWMKTLDPG